MTVAQTQSERFSRARKALVADVPWFGILSLHLKPVEDADEAVTKTGATDGTHCWYSPKFLATLSDRQVRTLIAHEALHCGLKHPYRTAGKNLDDANVAADHAINLLLTKVQVAGAAYFEPIPGWCCDPQYDGLDMEAIYARIRKAKQNPPPQSGGQQPQNQPQQNQPQQNQPQQNQPQQNQPQQGQPQQGQGAGQGQPDPNGQPQPGQPGQPQNGQPNLPGAFLPAPKAPDAAQPGQQGQPDPNGKPQPGQPGKADQAKPMTEADWDVAGEMAAMATRKAGKMPGEVDRALKASREARIDWRAETREFLTSAVPTDTSWSRPNRRFVGQGIYLPGNDPENLATVGLYVDVSGSVSQRDLDAFAAEVTGVLQDARPEKLKVVFCDTTVRATAEFEPDDEVVLKACGGGGTRFAPVFEHFAEDPPVALICLTDLDGRDNHTLVDPGYPVLWVTSATVRQEGPFGRTVRFDPV
jgi:predicted metal-dependent peptidase